MFKKIFKAGYTTLEVFIRTIYFVLGVIFISWVAYLFGHVILDGNYKDTMTTLVGNDSTFAISLVYWFEKFYPKIPIWYTVQGMGVSLFYSYPIWTTFLNIFLKNISGMSAVEIYRILSFISFPLTAIGIYVFAWSRTKKQTVGLLAGIFFLLSQASWLFQSLHGIFAQSFSFIFVAPTLMFFDLFLEKTLKGESKKILSRIYFSLTVFMLGLTFLMHFVTGVMVTITIILWGILYYLLSDNFKFSIGYLSERIIKGLVVSGLVVILAYFIGAFWLIPFNRYTNLANVGGFNTRSLEALQQESLRIPSLLGIKMLGEGEFRYDFFFFAGSVLVFFAIGLIASIIKKNKFIFVSSIISIFFIFLTTIPIYLPWLADLFKFFFTGVYFRGIIPALILLPIVSAWGVWALANIISIPLKNLKIKPVNDLIRVVVSLIMLLISFYVVSNFKTTPPPNSEFEKSYKYEFQPYGPSLSEDFNKFLKNPYLPNSFPAITINKRGLEGKTLLNEALSQKLISDETTIFDVSPYAAGGAIMQGAGILNNSRFVNLYHYYASLIHGMWGYQAGEFYGGDKLYISPKPLSDLSDWFGIKYVVLTPGFDPFYKYQEAGYVPREDFNIYARSKDSLTGKDNWGIEVWENPKSTGLFTITNKPAVLVIGNEKVNAYDNVFRSGNLGALNYKDALIVQGTVNIDDYSLSELKTFHGIILNGYSYKNKGRAWNILKEYLESGGRIFVDTGWQYEAGEWEGKNLPEVFPVTKTTWGNIGDGWNGITTSFTAPDFSNFDPLTYKDGSWNMAIALKSDLRPEAKVLISKDDQVLMAEMLVGKGKIVWSGMNIFSHIAINMNDSPASMLGQILTPLFLKTDVKDYLLSKYERPTPDHAEIIISEKIDEPSWLLFREAYSPYFNTAIVNENETIKPKVFKAGPGFILIRLPKVNPGDKIQIDEKLSFTDGFIAKLITMATIVFVVAFIFIGDKIISFMAQIPVNKFTQKFSKNISSSFTQDENDY